MDPDTTALETGFLHVLFDHAPFGLALLDPEFRYVRVNSVLAAINGVPADDHTGRTVREILPDMAPAIEAMLRSVLEEGRPMLELEIAGPTPAQADVERFFAVSFYPIVHHGAALGVGGLTVETTDRVVAERSLQTQAAHVYEDVVQKLAVVQMALESGESERAYESVKQALASAKQVASRIMLRGWLEE